MAKTKQQLSTAVLKQMNEVGAGQTPDADDASYVEDRYDVKLEEWRELGHVWWTNTTRYAEEIPTELFTALVDLMENEVMSSFGRENPPLQRRAQENLLLGFIARINSRRASDEQTTFDVY